MPNILLTGVLTPNANLWTSDPTFGNGTRRQLTVTYQTPGGSTTLPAHTYTAGTLVVKWHVAAPYTNNWPYYFTLRVDANYTRNPYSLFGSHDWRQPFNSPNAGPGAALEDDFALPNVWLAFVNAASGATLTTLLNLNGAVQVPNGTTIIIDSVTLNLAYNDAPGSSFAKRWSAALVDGRALCTFVDTAGALQVSTSRSVKGNLTAGKGAGWTAPFPIAAHSADCNVGIHPGKGRGQIWYTQTDAAGANPASVYTTSASAGTAFDWTSPTTITPRASYTFAQLTQPYSPIYSSGSGTYKYVTSQSSGTGLDVGAAGKDGRLCWYPSALYTVTSGGGTLVATGFCCKDDGQGATWDWRNLVSSGPFNSYDGAPDMPARDNDSPYPGKAYGQTTGVNIGGTLGGVLAKSAVVKGTDDSLYQLLFSQQYSRRAKVVPRAGTATAGTNGNQWQNNVNNNPPTSTTQTTNYTLSVPAGSESIRYLKLNWLANRRERALVSGTLDNANHPTKVTFSIPALGDIPAYNDLGHPEIAYGGASYLKASIELDVVYIGAKGLQIAFTHDLTLGAAGAKYPPAQQAKLQVLEGRGEYVGSAFFDYYGDFDIDRARSSTIQFDVLLTGTCDTFTIKSAKLRLHNMQCEIVGDTLTLASAQMPTSAAPLSTVYGVAGLEFFTDVTYPVAGYTLFAPTDTSLLDEVNGRRGTDWAFDLTWTQNNGQGTGGSNKPLPFDTQLLAQYAQCTYQANPTDSAKGDFFFVRSRDRGRTWEYAADGKAISALNSLRDWNNANPAEIKMPSLLTEDNALHCVFVERDLVKTVSSQDAGETWTAAG